MAKRNPHAVRRGDKFRVGPIRIHVAASFEGRCALHTFYGEKAHLGLVYDIAEEVVIEMKEQSKHIVDFTKVAVCEAEPVKDHPEVTRVFTGSEQPTTEIPVQRLIPRHPEGPRNRPA